MDSIWMPAMLVLGLGLAWATLDAWWARRRWRLDRERRRRALPVAAGAGAGTPAPGTAVQAAPPATPAGPANGLGAAPTSLGRAAAPRGSTERHPRADEASEPDPRADEAREPDRRANEARESDLPA